MKSKPLKNFLFVAVLIVATGVAMAYSSGRRKPVFLHRTDGIVKVAAHLIQDKVLQGSQGLVGLSLTLGADEAPVSGGTKPHNVDMVIVLDRSGSMKGRKIQYARRAVSELLSRLSPNDRLALITYSDGVRTDSPLLSVTADNRRHLLSAVRRIRAGGGTNLGAGLQAGINLLASAASRSKTGKVILISDGLANQGLTDIRALSDIAAGAVRNEFAVSTVGVGVDFNEQLMTAVADHGTGSYYYLENPAAFAEVFQKEFDDARAAAATALSVHIPLNDGIRLIDAAGYPVSIQNGAAVFYPGNLLSGRTRRLFLTLQVPTGSTRTFILDPITIRYHHNRRIHETTGETSFRIACVKDRQKVYSSIDKTAWSQKIIHNDFNRLKQEVAADIKSGKKLKALNRIEKYYGEQQSVNAVLGSAKVAENLDKDLKELRTVVEDTFQGAPGPVRQKQKSNAKALQYEGYRGRRQ